MKRLIAILFSLIILFSKSYSQKFLTIDSTFGINGTQIVSNPFGSNYFYPQGQQLFLSDGSILQLVTDEYIDTFNYYIKTKPDGSQDASFGDNGLFKFKLKKPASNFTDIFSLMALDSFFILSGVDDSFGFIMKVKNNGIIDSTFGDDGFIYESYKSINLSSNILNNESYIFETINLSTYKYNYNKYNQYGELDTMFNYNFKITLSKYPGYDVNRLFVINENEILVKFYNDSIIKVNGQGVLINNFLFSQKVSDTISVYSSNFVDIDADESIYIFGNFFTGSNNFNNLFIIKINSNGKLDKRFNNTGVLILNSNDGKYGTKTGVNRYQWFKLDSSLFLITEESFDNSAKRKRVISRYNLNGKIDKSFHDNGRWVVDTLESLSVSSNRMRPLMSTQKHKNRIYLYGKDGLGFTFRMFVMKSYDTTDSTLTSIQLAKSENDFTIFPNPVVDNILYVASSDSISYSEISIYNIEGKKVLSSDKMNTFNKDKVIKINLPPSIKAGVYFLEYKTKDKKISKQILVY